MKEYTLKAFNRRANGILAEAVKEDILITRHGKGYILLKKYILSEEKVCTNSDKGTYNSKKIEALKKVVKGIENRSKLTGEYCRHGLMFCDECHGG